MMSISRWPRWCGCWARAGAWRSWGQTAIPRAVEEIDRLAPDALFLDIHMPEIDGFQLLERLSQTPHVIFTTAYDQHAVRAFEVNSLDYLLKPVSEERLILSIARLEERCRGTPPPAVHDLLAQLAQALPNRRWMERITTRHGDHFLLIELREVTHFLSRDRYTFACTGAGEYLVNLSLGDLETRLDPGKFLRIHRSAIVNLSAVDRLSRWFAGQLMVRLKDPAHTELTVSREKVAKLREALGLE
jgi:DNA-binding LytR/AlgR family response regulator